MLATPTKTAKATAHAATNVAEKIVLSPGPRRAIWPRA
jgi:hypothetical protein